MTPEQKMRASAAGILFFDERGVQIAKPTNAPKPSPVRITVGEMHRHFHAVAAWMRSTEARA